jgi:hypothetical protein
MAIEDGFVHICIAAMFTNMHALLSMFVSMRKVLGRTNPPA